MGAATHGAGRVTAIDRALEYWPPEPLLDGQTVFVLGNGPSLVPGDVDRLQGHPVIAINSACRMAPWAPFLWFWDTHWFHAHRAEVDAWPGLVITSDREAKRAAPDRVHRIETVPSDEFLVGRATVREGRSSGHVAISLAIAMGAIRVVLLGFDMRRVEGRSHWHDEYATQDDNLFSRDFLPGFTGWREAARRCGVRIVNCAPGSALKEFPMATLDDVLRSE